MPDLQRSRMVFDCGHRCCDTPNDPHHSHYLEPKDCGGCQRQPTDVPMFDLPPDPGPCTSKG